MPKLVFNLGQMGIEYIDLGFGDADYKRLYATEQQSEELIHLYGSGGRALISWMIDSGTRRSAQIAARLTERRGLAARMKRLWRRRLE